MMNNTPRGRVGSVGRVCAQVRHVPRQDRTRIPRDDIDIFFSVFALSFSRRNIFIYPTAAHTCVL